MTLPKPDEERLAAVRKLAERWKTESRNYRLNRAAENSYARELLAALADSPQETKTP